MKFLDTPFGDLIGSIDPFCQVLVFLFNGGHLLLKCPLHQFLIKNTVDACYFIGGVSDIKGTPARK